MKVKVIRISDDFLINIRTTDELLEDGFFRSEAECEEAESCLRRVGRWYRDAEMMLFKA